MQQWGGDEINLADGVRDDLVTDLLATYVQQFTAHLTFPPHQHAHHHSDWLFDPLGASS